MGCCRVAHLDPFTILSRSTSTVHSMARANLNENEKFSTNTTSASKFISKRPRICINRNPPFQTSLYKFFKNCCLWNKSYFTTLTFRGTFTKKNLVWKREFSLMQILGLLGMYFDAVIVFVNNFSPLFRLALGILWVTTKNREGFHWNHENCLRGI
jgi:hypothetical protein